MKDPNDKKTIDGFADLVTLVEQGALDDVPACTGGELSDLVDKMRGVPLTPKPAKKKAGRKPAGEKALTPAEKQKAYRLREKSKKLEHEVRLLKIRTGLPVTSEIIDLDTSFNDLYRTLRKPE